MPTDPYTVDPNEGLIYSGWPDNLGDTVDAIYIHGFRYTLEGSSLVPESDTAPTYPLPNNRISLVGRESDMGAQIAYEVSQRQLNRGVGAQRVYGLTGTVNLFMGELGFMEVELNNDMFTKTGYRFYQTSDEFGNTIYGETAFNFDSNAQLKEALYDPEARYLSPTEALRVNFSRWLMSTHQDLIQDYLRDHISEFPTGVNKFYYAADIIASQSDLSQLRVMSNYWV